MSILRTVVESLYGLDDTTELENVEIEGNVNIHDTKITINSDLLTSEAPTQDLDIVFNRGSSTDAHLRWNETSDQFEFNNNLQTRYIYPDTTNVRDIGSSSKNYKDLYLSGSATVDTITSKTGDLVLDSLANGGITISNSNSGRVGVYCNPSSLFHILEDSNATGSTAGLTIEQLGIGDSVIQFLLTGAQRWVMGCDNTDDSFKVSSTADLGTNCRLSITTSGDIGMGIQSPTHKLHVVGDTLIDLDNTVNDGLTIQDGGEATSGGGTMSDSSGAGLTNFYKCLKYEKGTSHIHMGLAGTGDDYVLYARDTVGGSPDVEIAYKQGTGIYCTSNYYGNVGNDSTSIFGHTRIGSTAESNQAVIQNQALSQASGNYALRQNTVGSTILNSASGQTLHLRINNADALKVSINKTINVYNDILPDTTDSHDIGSASLKFQDLHLNGTSISNELLVGTSSSDSTALAVLDSTTKGFLPPRMTTAQRDAITTPTEGLVVYDTDLETLAVRNSSTWLPLSVNQNKYLMHTGNANQSISAATSTVVNFEDQVHNTFGSDLTVTTDNTFKNTSGRNMVVDVHSTIRSSGNKTGQYQIWINNTSDSSTRYGQQLMDRTAGGNYCLSCSAEILLANNESIQVFVWFNQADTIGDSSDNVFKSIITIKAY